MPRKRKVTEISFSRPDGFLNVDLEIESRSDLDSLASELEKGGLVVLYSGPGKKRRFMLCLETIPGCKNPDATIRAFCKALQRLSASGKRLWKSAHRKEFDVGYELLAGQRSLHFSLSTESLKLVASIGATLAATTYYPEK